MPTLTTTTPNNHAWTTDDPQRLEQVCQGLSALAGSLKDPIQDASTTIDALLYGEGGAWSGSDAFKVSANPL